MKTRQGFVSNSSASNFLVHVWIRPDALRHVSRLYVSRRLLVLQPLHRTVVHPPTEWHPGPTISGEQSLLPPEKVEALLQRGFRWTEAWRPSSLDYFSEEVEEDAPDASAPNLYLCVSCNQSEVVAFLIKERVPFRASIEHGDEFYVWDGRSAYVKSYPNLGSAVEMYGFPVAVRRGSRLLLSTFAPSDEEMHL
jgi:hypothetical protein